MTPEERWEQGIPHRGETEDVGGLLEKYTDLSFGGDGDDGEQILYVLDIYFEGKAEEALWNTPSHATGCR